MNTALLPVIAAGTWTADPVHSSAGFRIKHFGLTWLRGSFTEFDVTLTSSDDGISISGSTPVSSISFRNEQLAGHLQSPEFFDAQLHPGISFHAAQLALNDDGSLSGQGSLTMRGVTRDVELAGTWSGAIEDMSGGQRIAIDLTTTIDRTLWGISWNAKLAGGNDVVGNTVQIDGSFELVQQ